MLVREFSITEVDMKFGRLLSPIKIGGLELKNRMFVTKHYLEFCHQNKAGMLRADA